jgi:subtilisin family serine protease/subtilisin-like proprotein convertase family protein
LTLARTVTQNVFIFQARDALTAMREAQRLGQMRGVEVSHPVQRRLQIRKHGPYAARPNDTYFYDQWNLENRNTGGGLIGPDLNVRAAWPFTLGEGVVLAIADDGVELTHPEFAIHATNGLHFNFVAETTNAMPEDPDDIHATAVAGLALAQANNRRGMAGVAPAARLASWKIFQGAVLKSTDEQLLDMFQFRSNLVSVQNHSWGNAGREQLAPTTLESIGISNAITFGRNGRGIIMVRSAGNGRNNPDQSDDANDDGYANDPRVICVASIRRDRRTASYSSRGACLLTAAPGGDWDRSILTTDRQGSEGYNTATYTNDFADYVSLPDISGTSFAAPQVSGLTALILGANPNLTYRDVQQILLLSSRHFDLNDPDLRTNRAGLLVSHNLGFGVPDAGWAVALARSWVNRPEVVTLAVSATDQRSIPEDGLRVVLSGANVPATLSSIPASPSVGPHTDTPTPLLPLVDVGSASSPITTNLTGKGALIQRDGVIPYSDKIQRAAVAGAAFAIISNHLDEDPPRRVMLGTEYVSIPAVMIDQSSGAALRDYLQLNPNAPARIQLEAAAYHLSITNTLLCEHVGVRVQISHERRGDLRITLLSPGGTRSVLQRLNLDTSPGPSEWTYYSTHHFYESSAGIWTISISDEEPLNTGSVQSVELIIRGVSIADVDADGLDDDWETAHFGSLASGPQDDSDGDGYNNLREQVMGTDPKAVDVAFAVHFSPWDAKLARLSWPGVSNRMFEVLAATNALAPLMPIMNLPGRFPETEWFTPYTNQAQLFFRVRAESP